MGLEEFDTSDGGRTLSYAWGQTQEEVHVYVPVPPGTAPINVHVRTTPHTLLVELKGTPDGAVLVEGGLSRAVKPDESTWTIEGKHKDVVHVYMEKADSDLMWSSVIEGHVDADAGANLLSAAREGRASDVVRLLRSGVDVNHADAATGFTALHWAAACGQVEVLSVLMDLAPGIELDKPDKEKSTPLLVAVTNMQTKAALALLEGKADVNVRNFVGGTPLMIAAGVGEVTLIKAMIRSGANPNAQDAGGLTAAMHASRMGNPAVIVMLIQEANIDVSLRDNNGQTALDLAADQPTIDTLTKDSIFLRAHGRQFI